MVAQCGSGALAGTLFEIGVAVQARFIELKQSTRLLVIETAGSNRGLDVGAIEYVHRRLVEQRDAGCAVLLVSFELDEVLDLADRILVMYGGQIVLERLSGQTDERELGIAMTGGAVPA